MTRLEGITGKLCAAFLLLFVLHGCDPQQPALPVITVEHGPNAVEQRQKPYVVLVSLDGYRYDYAKIYGATHLLAIAARGASAPDGMIPSYPSVTFPNHYTIVTGLYPEHHGIVANNFYDPERKKSYKPAIQRRPPTEAGTEELRSGRLPKIRACAAPAFSGPARKLKSPANVHPTI